jgi:hypothetical protein
MLAETPSNSPPLPRSGDADPLADIRNTRRIHAVIANGRVVREPDAGS